MAFRRLAGFYQFEVGSYGTRYVVLLVITVQFSVMALLLDAARVSMKLFNTELSSIFLSVGILTFLSDILLGILEKSYRARTKGSLLMVVLESARTTSYGVLPFLWFAMSVLLFFGGPSASFFPFLKTAMFLFTFLAALPSLVKTLAFQIPLLFNTVWDSKLYKIILASSALAIMMLGVYSHFASVYTLPMVFSTWFMYVTSMMFLEVFLLFVMAETLINFRRDLYVFAVILYLLVVTYSTLGVMETSKLRIETYGEVLPKALTGLALIIVNVKLIDLRLLSSIRSEGSNEIRQTAYESSNELRELLQKLYEEAVENRKSIQRQQRALLELYNLMSKGSSTSTLRPRELQEELERIRTFIEKTSVGMGVRLTEVVRSAVMDAAKQSRYDTRSIVAYILGPRISAEEHSRRKRMLEELSPIVPLVFAYVAYAEISTGSPQRRIKRVSFADFLRLNYPPFGSIWSRRTIQDFVKDLIDNYLLAYEESSCFFKPVGLEIEILENDANRALLELFRDQFVRERGEFNMVLLLHELRKTKRALKEEFGLKDEDIFLYRQKK
jgi:alkylhydroperoxidase/carboxymuconolactone decarboxylase family protein YurZ